MRFIPLTLVGAFRIELEPLEDERGSFTRTWCLREAEIHGLQNMRIVQCNVSRNFRKGTLRGMHYQVAPFPEAKLIRCTRGSVIDVLIDIRPDSPTYGNWEAVELTENNAVQLFIPEGFAHGFQTLTDDTEIFYQMSEYHHPECARGLRWNDPAFNIRWPLEVPILSVRDARFPDFQR